MPRRKQGDDDRSVSVGLMRQFLSVYDAAERTSSDTYRELFSHVKEYKYTTLFGQLSHLVEVLAPTTTSTDEGRNLGLLFSRKEAGYKPTALAALLKGKFEALVEANDALRDDVRQSISNSKESRHISIGVTQAISIRLMSPLLSIWDNVFSDIDLRVRVGNSPHLIQRLKVGLVDCVVCYGGTGKPPMDNVVFSPVGYDSRHVLLAPPKRKLFADNGREMVDLNSGDYWKHFLRSSPASGQSRVGKKHPPHSAFSERLTYDTLREARISAIDLSKSGLKLFVVDSFWHSPGLKDFLDRKPQECVVVDQYEDALALVRFGNAVAIAPETFHQRSLITAFRLAPAEEFTRPIGVFHSTAFPEHKPVKMLTAFLTAALAKFHDEVCSGDVPSLANDEYVEWAADWAKAYRLENAASQG